MRALALADVLQDFGAARQAPSAPIAEQPVQKPEDTHRKMPPDIETPPVEEVVASAEAALTERLAAEHAAMVAEIEGRHEAELERLRAEFGDQAGRIIMERLTELEQQVVALASSVVARILGVALSEDVKRSAIEELGRSILAAIGDREAVRIRIKGPLLLYEALKPGLGRFADQVEFSETADFDLTVSVDNTLFETRVAEWSTALSEVLA